MRERWRHALENRGMKIIWKKAECMCVNEKNPNETVRLQEVDIKKVGNCVNLGSTVLSVAELKKRLETCAGEVGGIEMSIRCVE